MPYAQAIQRKPDWWRRELPLVPDNNIIIGDDNRFAYARSKLSEEHLRDYVSDTLRLISGHLEDFGLSAPQAEQPNLVLGDIEFYSEFRSQDPINLVDVLKYYMTPLGIESGENFRNIARPRNQRVTDNSTAQVRSSNCFYFIPRRGVRLKVYAKTDRRIRFEVSFSNVFRIRGLGRRTFETVDGLVEAVIVLKGHAANLINLAIEDAWGQMNSGDSELTPEQFSNLVCSKTLSPHIASSVLKELRHKGRVAPFPNDPRYPLLRKLKKDGILYHPRSSRRLYVISPQYREAARYPQPPAFRRRSTPQPDIEPLVG